MRSQIWTRQPQYQAGIDWENPIARGLAFAANAGAGFQDAYTGRFATPNGVLPYAVSRNGRGYDAASNSSIGAAWAGSRLSTSTGNGQGEFTVLVLSNPVASTTREMLFSVTNGATEFYLVANANVALAATSGNVSGSTNSGGAQGVAVAGAADGNWHVYAYGRTGGTVGTGKLWVDGTATTAVITANAAMWSSTSANNIGGYTGANWGISGNVPLALAWNRLLDDAEVIALTRNPWQIFKPLQARTLFGVSGASDTGVFSADGVATVSGVGSSLFKGVASSDGVAAASGVGSSLAASIFSSDGVATVAGVGNAATADNIGVFDAAGSATVSGVGAAIIQAVFGAAGSATVSGVSTASAETSAGYSYDEPKRKRRGKRLIVDGEFIYSDDPRLPAKLAALAEKAEKAAEPAPTLAPEPSALGTARKAVKKARQLATRRTISIPQDAPGEIDPQTYALLEVYQARVNDAFNRALVRRIEELQFLEELRDEEEVLILAALMG